MTLNSPTSRLCAGLVAFALCLGLAGCNGDGSSKPGIRVMTQTTYLTSDTPSGDPDGTTDPAQEPSAIKPLYRDDNMYIQLQLGLVNLQVTDLVKCESVIARAAGRTLDFLFPAAHAHTAHIPSGPAGVIDVLKPDLLVWDLGVQGAQAGQYCGLELRIAPLRSAAEAEVEMAGQSLLVSPCYYPDTAGTPRSPLDSQASHSCIEVAYQGEASATVLFAQPLVLNSEHRGAHLMLATAYDRWFDGLDMTLLADDLEQQEKLADNILASFYLYAQE